MVIGGGNSFTGRPSAILYNLWFSIKVFYCFIIINYIFLKDTLRVSVNSNYPGALFGLKDYKDVGSYIASLLAISLSLSSTITTGLEYFSINLPTLSISSYLSTSSFFLIVLFWIVYNEASSLSFIKHYEWSLDLLETLISIAYIFLHSLDLSWN